MTEADFLLEALAVEYRLFTQRGGHAPTNLLLSKQQAHRFGTAVLERFKQEVAPNITIQVSPYCPDAYLYFYRSPGLLETPPPRLPEGW